MPGLNPKHALKSNRRYSCIRSMPFLPVTPEFFALLHDAWVEQLVFEAPRGRS